MRLTPLAAPALALTLALCGARLSAVAQLYSPLDTGPLSAFEFHDGTYTTVRGASKTASLRLMMTTGRSGGRNPRYATLVEKTPDGLAKKLDSVISFTFDARRFVQIDQLTKDRSLRDELNTEFVEVFQDTGRIELYRFYPIRGNRFVLAAFSPGVIRENDLTYSYIWRRHGTPGFEVMARVPPRGNSPEFERQLRALFADRPDIVQSIDQHDVRRQELPAVVKAYNARLPIRFE